MQAHTVFDTELIGDVLQQMLEYVGGIPATVEEFVAKNIKWWQPWDTKFGIAQKKIYIVTSHGLYILYSSILRTEFPGYYNKKCTDIAGSCYVTQIAISENDLMEDLETSH